MQRITTPFNEVRGDTRLNAMVQLKMLTFDKDNEMNKKETSHWINVWF